LAVAVFFLLFRHLADAQAASQRRVRVTQRPALSVAAQRRVNVLDERICAVQER
jgi:hypothetical protein